MDGHDRNWFQPLAWSALVTSMAAVGLILLEHDAVPSHREGSATRPVGPLDWERVDNPDPVVEPVKLAEMETAAEPPESPPPAKLSPPPEVKTEEPKPTPVEPVAPAKITVEKPRPRPVLPALPATETEPVSKPVARPSRDRRIAKIVLDPVPEITPVGKSIKLVARAVNENGDGLPGVVLDWVIDPLSAGYILGLEPRGSEPHSTVWLAPTHARSQTASQPPRGVNRPNPLGPAVQPTVGESWCMVQANQPGETRVTVLALMLDQESSEPARAAEPVTFSVYWNNAEARFPESQTLLVGEPAELTTMVIDPATSRPIAGQRVRYSVRRMQKGAAATQGLSTPDRTRSLYSPVTFDDPAPPRGFSQRNAVGPAESSGRIVSQPAPIVDQSQPQPKNLVEWGQVVAVMDGVTDSSGLARVRLADELASEPGRVQVLAELLGATAGVASAPRILAQQLCIVTWKPFDVDWTGDLPALAGVNEWVVWKVTLKDPQRHLGRSSQLLLEVPAELEVQGGTGHESRLLAQNLVHEQTISIRLRSNEPGQFPIRLVLRDQDRVIAARSYGIDVARAQLGVEKRWPTNLLVGVATEVELEMVNQGKVGLPALRLHDELPDMLSLESVGDGLRTNSGMVWSVPALAPGARWVAKYRVIPNRPAIQHAVMTSWTAVESSDSESPRLSGSLMKPLNITGIAGLRLVIQDMVDPLPVDGEVEYQVTLENTGWASADQIRLDLEWSNNIRWRLVEGNLTGGLLEGRVSLGPVVSLPPQTRLTARLKGKLSSAGTARLSARMYHAAVGNSPLIVEENTVIYDPKENRSASSAK